MLSVGCRPCSIDSVTGSSLATSSSRRQPPSQVRFNSEPLPQGRIHPSQDSLFGGAYRFLVSLRKFGGQRLRYCKQLVLRRDPVHQPDAERFIGEDSATGEEEIQGSG